MIAAGVVVSLGLLRGADLTHRMLHDSRYSAGRWLAAAAAPADALEYFGPSQKLPPLPESVVTRRAAPYAGAVERVENDDATVEAILMGWQRRTPEFILVAPDHSSLGGDPHSETMPDRVYRGLLEGRYGYEQAYASETTELFPWLPKPPLDYPSVNPPIRVFTPDIRAPHETTEPADRDAGEQTAARSLSGGGR